MRKKLLTLAAAVALLLSSTSAYAFLWPGSRVLCSAPQLFNVKDYGAVGDGVHDDTTAIQAAITACDAAGTGPLGNNAGVVEFPCGRYKVTSLLTAFKSGGGESGMTFLGYGEQSSVIVGDVADYIISIGVGAHAGAGHWTFINLGIINTNTSGSIPSGQTAGALQIIGCGNALVSNCYLSSQRGRCIDDWNAGFSTEIVATTMVGNYPSVTGSLGAMMGQHTTLSNCRFVSLNAGMFNYGPEAGECYGCLFETCGTGVNLGVDETTTRHNAVAGVLKGCQFASCIFGVLVNTVSYYLIQDVNIYAVSNSTRQCNTGLWVSSGSSVVLVQITVNGEFSGSATQAYSTGAASLNVGVYTLWYGVCTAINTGNLATNWVFAAGSKSYQFIYGITNMPTPADTYANVSALTGNQGMKHWITNGSTNTLGAPVVGGGVNRVCMEFESAAWRVTTAG